MLEIEQASANSEARDRLEQMRTELGIPARTAGAVEAGPTDTDGS